MNEKHDSTKFLLGDLTQTKLRQLIWCLVGGGIEPGESLQEAALREIHEEVGIGKEDIELGPVVWHASFDFVRLGVQTHTEEHFIVAKTKKKKVTPEGLTPCEEEVIKEMAWMSLEKIKQLTEKVYPVSLAEHLPDVLAGKYPEKPIKIKAN